MTPSFLTDDVKSQIATYCNLTPDKESCGLILNDGTVLLSPNTIDGSGLAEFDENGELQELTEETGALIDVDLYLEHEDNIACFWHSHSDEMVEGWLSFTDIDQSRFHGIPYLLYHTKFATWDYFDPNYHHPFPLLEKATSKTKIDYYLKWPWSYGRSDCASLLKSYLKNVVGHEFPDYPRPVAMDWYKDSNYETKYLELFQDPVNGFTQINTASPKKDDVILMRFFGSRQPCHVGVMVTDQTFLHLLQPGHLSEVVPFGGAWKRGLHSVWRIAKND
jgi:proteasome lid subunit RPN8/RPN11